MEKRNGDIYLEASTPAGTPCARRPTSTRSETTLGDDGVRREPLGSPVEWTEEETYFFRLSAYQDKLLAHYETHPDFILPPERRNEVVSFVKARAGGSVDLAHDARLGHPGAGRTPEHVMYVWVDALTNYITAAGFPDENGAALALLAGRRARHRQGHRALPRRLLAGVPDVGGHRAAEARLRATASCYNRGEKMSKSVGNVVDPFDLVKAYGVDQVRYFFLREVVFGQDGNYSHEAIVNRINADLANDLGNLAQRSLSMIAKNCDGDDPEPGDVQRGRQGDPGGGRRHVRQGARGHGPAGHQALSRRRVGRGGGCQPLLRGRGAVGASARPIRRAWRRSST